MGIFITKNSKVYIGAVDISPYIKKGSMSVSVEPLDATVWGDSTKKKKAGLIDTKLSFDGFWDDSTIAESVTAQMFNKVAAADADNVTAYPESSVEGSVGFSFAGLVNGFKPGLKVGELMSFAGEVSGHGNLIQQTNVFNALKSGAGTSYGTAFNLGQVSANQTLYGFVHVLTKSGTNPTLAMEIESDNVQGFTSPISRLSFDAITGVTSQAKSVAGLVADDWWRMKFVLGGTLPAFTIVAGIGIK